MKRGALLRGGAVVVAALSIGGRAAATSNKIAVEGTGTYDGSPTQPNCCGGTGCNIPLAVTEADRFYSWMTTPLFGQPSVPWVGDVNWRENDVWDTDFLDNNRTAAGTDLDTQDKQGSAISFFAGHGFCNHKPNAPAACITDAQCTTPHAGASLPGFCQLFPTNSTDWLNGGSCTSGACCTYTVPKSAQTCSWNDQFGTLGTYTNGNAAWGESALSGSWAGANTNGGTNMMIHDISCPVDPRQHITQITPAFAGLHIWASLIHWTGDTLDTADRAVVAIRSQLNPSASAAQSWLETINDLASSTPATTWNCTGQGLTECGGHYVVALDSTADKAVRKVDTESWDETRQDGFDSTGNGSFAWRALCNFGCAGLN